MILLPESSTTLSIQDSYLHLRFLRLLARGSSGSVFLASAQTPPHYSTPFPPLVAVKVFSKSQGPHVLQRCRNEEQILRRIRQSPSPFLPTLHCTFEDAHFCYLVLDYFAGGDLHSLRHSLPDKRFSCDAIRFYAAEIALALEHLHGCGIVHRDLKPENIMLTSEGHIVLTDFDVSAIVSSNDTEISPEPEDMQSSLGAVIKLEASTAQERSHAVRSELRRSCSEATSGAADKYSNVASNSRRSYGTGGGDSAVAASVYARNASNGGGTISYNRTKSSRIGKMRDVLQQMRKWKLGKWVQRNPSTRQGRVTPSVAAEEEGGKQLGLAEEEIVGTDEYLAPEAVAAGVVAVGEAADWWAVGVLVYEMVYGRTPFKGRSSRETLERVAAAKGDVELQGLSDQPELRQLMAELLVRDPARRLCSLRRHHFFRHVQWSHLPDRLLRPPFLPSAADDEDASSSRLTIHPHYYNHNHSDYNNASDHNHDMPSSYR